MSALPFGNATPRANVSVNNKNERRNEEIELELALEINSCRVLAVAEQLAMCAHSSLHFQRFHALCLSLSRGIDYGLAQNEVPAHALKLPPVLKMVCSRKNEFILQPAIMVLMFSVKNACKSNWFPARDTEELLALADEVASNFVTRKDSNFEVCTILPTVSTIISRYYPHFKLGNVLSSLEVTPGYGVHLVDFHITKDIVIAKEEKIYLFVAMKDNIDTSSCIITPQEVNILLNGKAVERRNRAHMDSGPQLPTAVNHYLKYGINLLQVVGQFNGDYIFIIGLMSYTPSSSDLLLSEDYKPPVSASVSVDSELIEGPSLVSLNCPISKTRIKTPVKGHLCKHYQCFDLTTYVDMNFKRPLWRCPSCNQAVSFTDLRVDRKMVKALEVVGRKESEVIYSIDGSFKPISSNKHKDESHDKALANQLGGHELESPTMLNGPGNMCDLTGEDDEMDTTDQCEPVDTKPVVHPNGQAQSLPSIIALPPSPGSTTELSEFSSAQVSNVQSPLLVIDSFLSAGFNSRPQAQIGGMSGTLTANYGMAPVLTDAVSPALSRQPDSSQGFDFPINSNSTPTNLQGALYSQGMNSSMQFTRNFTRVSSAIQALPVQAPITSPQQHSGCSVRLPSASRPPASSQVPAGFNDQFSSSSGSNVEKQQYLSQSHANSLSSDMASVSPQNRSLSAPVQQGVVVSTPTHNSYMSHTLSQPPHMRASPLPRNQNQHGVGPRAVGNNSSTSTLQGYLQRVQLTGSQTSHMRPPHTAALQTQAAIRIPTSSQALSSGGSVAPQAVSRTENPVHLQSEKNWRPINRMRGALVGEDYVQALNQMTPAVPPAKSPRPRPRPSVPLPGTSRPNIEVLLANRRIASELQNQSANGTQVEGSHGVNNST